MQYASDNLSEINLDLDMYGADRDSGSDGGLNSEDDEMCFD